MSKFDQNISGTRSGKISRRAVVRTAIKAEKNIPIISYNSIITSPKIDFWTARDNYQVGELQAKKALVDRPTAANWAIVSGPQGLDIAQQKTEGALRVLKPLIDSGKIK